MRYAYHLDYMALTYPVEAITPSKVAQLLIGTDDIGFKRVGGSDERPWFSSPMGIFFKSWNGSQERPISVHVKGVGCEHFETVIKSLLLPEAFITRLDFCFDVVLKKDVWKRFIKKAFVMALDRNDGTVKCPYKYSMVGNGQASTVYVGSRYSGKYFRIYNKTLQSKSYQGIDVNGQPLVLADDEFLIRFEVELHPVTEKSCTDLRDLAPYLDHYLQCDDAFFTEKFIAFWSKISDFVPLPKDFLKSEWVSIRLSEAYHSFECHPSEVLDPAVFERLHKVLDARKYEYPHTFDDKLFYMVNMYGKYVPWVLRDQRLLNACYVACAEAFGYDQKFYVEPIEMLNYDVDSDDLDDVSPGTAEVFVQASLDINSFEGG